ncbi:DUF2851 family protein [Chloroflexota bacterium]
MDRLYKKFSENQFVEVWKGQLFDKTGLATEDGEPIDIIYPGRLNDGEGADFRDTIIVTSRGMLKGDVEIHVRSSEWQNHKHHCNPAYNRVILHVVMWHNARTATWLENGRQVPVLALHKYIKTTVQQWCNSDASPATCNIPCHKIAQRVGTGVITGIIDKAGEERFLTKTAGFQRESTQLGVNQSLYQGIMGAMGYSRNKLAFLELARRLPLEFLELVADCGVSDEDRLAQLQTLLLGTAGLLSLENWDGYQVYGFGGEWSKKLRQGWVSYSHSGVMSTEDWCLFKVRPNNSPILRLVAMSYLLLRYREKGVLEGLLGLVEEVPVNRGHCRLERGLQITTERCRMGYYASVPVSRSGGLALLGSGRAAVIVVNVLLPFTLAWSHCNSRPELGEKAFDLY